jgi:hypothetical protein
MPVYKVRATLRSTLREASRYNLPGLIPSPISLLAFDRRVKNAESKTIRYRSTKEHCFSFKHSRCTTGSCKIDLSPMCLLATNYSPDDYLYRPDGETTVYITCSSKIMNTPSPSCLMMWDPFDSVYADATFSKDYLPQWREILSNIQKILDGQMVKGD